MKKRFLSVLLVICMVLTLMPVSAFAADADGAVTKYLVTAQPIDNDQILAGIPYINNSTLDRIELTPNIAIKVKPDAATDKSATIALSATTNADKEEDRVSATVDKTTLTIKYVGGTWGAYDGDTVVDKVIVGTGDDAVDYPVAVTFGYTVSGKVELGAGVKESVAKRSVNLFKESGGGISVGGTETNDDGEFIIEGVAPGKYTVAVDDYYKDGTTTREDMPTSEKFDVVDQDVSNIVITILPEGGTSSTTGYKVSGTVTAPTGVVLTGVKVKLTPASGTAEQADVADGEYEFTDVANGTYTLSIDAGEGYTAFTKSVTVNGAAVVENITLTAPDAPTYTVSGTVTVGSSGLEDLSGIVVTLYKVNDETAAATDTTATTTDGGAFTFTNIAAGEYMFVVAAVAGKYDKSESARVTVNGDRADVTIELFKKAEPTIDLEDVDGAYAKELEVAGTTTVTVTTGAEAVTASSSNPAAATVAVKGKAVTITAKAVGKSTITITSPDSDTHAAKTFTIAVTVKTKVLSLTVSTDVGASVLNQTVSDIQTDITVAGDTDTRTWKVRGTSNYIADWSDFSSDEGQTSGNYIVLKLESNEAEKIIITSPSEDNAEKELDDGILVTNFENVTDNKVPVKLVKTVGDVTITTNWTLDLTNVTRVEVSKDASLTAAMTDGAAKVTEGANGAPDEIAISLPSDASVALNSAAVTLTVNPKATVEYANGTDAPENTEGYTSGTNSAGTVSLSGIDFTNGNVLYVKVTAEDGNAVKNYVITASMTVIKLAAVETTTPDVEAIDSDKQGEVSTAATATEVETEPLKSAAFDAAVQDSTVTEEKAKEALDDIYETGDVYIYVIPHVEIVAKSYADGVYTVDVTPMARIVASTNADSSQISVKGDEGVGDDDADSVEMKDIELEKPGNINVTIGIPSELATTGEIIKITHVPETYVEKLTGATVTITVSHFSEFTVEKINGLTLDSLAVSEGILTPAFDAATKTYTVEVANSVSELTVTAKAATGISVTVKDKDGNVATGGLVDLAVGDNAVTVVLSAGGEEVTYTITVTRAEAIEVIPDEPGTSTGGGGGGTSSNVDLPSTPGGKVSVDNNGAKEGDTVTVTTTPNKGKVVDTVTVTDADGKNVPVTDLGNGKYSFVMPKGKVTVKVTFADDTSTGFTDVAADAYYADAVAWAVEKGITNGISDTMFGPENSCTRGQMVTFLWRLAGSPKASGTNPFADVASGSYYYDAVIWAVANGITNGTSDNTFSPEDTVTRGQSVTFLYRYAGMPASGSSNGFVDVAADAFYANAVNWAAANGVTNGTSDNTFTPEANCTRGQIVTFMFRYAG